MLKHDNCGKTGGGLTHGMGYGKKDHGMGDCGPKMKKHGMCGKCGKKGCPGCKSKKK